MMRSIFLWLASLLGTVGAVLVSYLWLDRPIALWANDHFWRPHRGILVRLGHIPDPLIPLAVVGFVLLGLRALLGRSFSKFQATIFVCSVSVIVAETIKNLLKFTFGRTWPETWVENNPSFIHGGSYGFHFMHGGAAYQSFPSGHMGASCTVLAVLWICYPRLRWLYAIAGLAVGAGLVAADYHFLGDVIAGAFVGISTGWMGMAIWKARTPDRSWQSDEGGGD
jgi:membrane-associated phospholipid phosphatase